MKTKSPYFYLFIFLFLNVLNFIDRNILFAFGNEIKADFNLTNTQWGLVSGIVFLFFYATCSIFIGALGDRLSRTKIIAIGLLLWSAMTALTGMAKSAVLLFVSRAFIGVGESSLTPSSISMLSDVFPQEKRGMAGGIYYLGIPLGVGLGFLIQATLGPILGWRKIFIGLGAIGALASIFIYFLTEPKRGEIDGKQDQEKSSSIIDSLKDTYKAVTSSKSLFFVILAGTLNNIPIGVGSFDTIWAVQERGFTAEQYNSMFGLYFIVGGAIGTIVGGYLSDLIGNKLKGGPMHFLFYSYLLMTPIVILYRFVSPDSIWFYASLFFISINISFFYGAVFSTIQNLTSTKIRGTVIGLWVLSVNIFGIALGAFLTGFFADNVFNNFQEPLTMTMITMGCFGLLAMICYYLAGIWYREDLLKVNQDIS
jgi:MFS family permease|tara:strand:+ start:16635 stop:17906 length:1272 start_codon:yes stop_codon:yes gene_type:complete